MQAPTKVKNRSTKEASKPTAEHSPKWKQKHHPARDAAPSVPAALVTTEITAAEIIIRDMERIVHQQTNEQRHCDVCVYTQCNNIQI